MAASIAPTRVAEIMLSWLDLDLVSCTKLQTLWAGYGHICAVQAKATREDVAAQWRRVCGEPQAGAGDDDARTFRLVLKLISPPPAQDGDEGHLRKMLSYEVEQCFYDDVAPGLLARGVAVASCLASTRAMSERAVADGIQGLAAILMTDLRVQFPVAGDKRSFLAPRQVHAALDWLAGFHSSSWDWLHGSRLDSFLRPPLDEAERRRLGARCGGQGLWLNGGYTYLATRRKEYASLAQDKSSEWSAAFCSPAADPASSGSSSSSIAEMVADFLTPTGRPFETYIHGDVKSENLFSASLGHQVAFFDFQYVGIGLGVCDLAKLFTCSVPLSMLASSRAMPHELPMGEGERSLLEQYRATLLSRRGPEQRALAGKDYDWDVFSRHWESALVDWCRFQASWGFWGNTQWLQARVRAILRDPGWRAWLQRQGTCRSRRPGAVVDADESQGRKA